MRFARPALPSGCLIPEMFRRTWRAQGTALALLKPREPSLRTSSVLGCRPSALPASVGWGRSSCALRVSAPFPRLNGGQGFTGSPTYDMKNTETVGGKACARHQTSRPGHAHNRGKFRSARARRKRPSGSPCTDDDDAGDGKSKRRLRLRRAGAHTYSYSLAGWIAFEGMTRWS